jgi:hypothetical protein
MTNSIAKTDSRISLLALLAVPAVLALACSDEIKNDYYSDNYYGDGGSAEPSKGGSGGEPTAAGGEAGEHHATGGSGGEAGEPSLADPRYPGAPVANTSVAELELDIFDTVGNRYWFGVSEPQRLRMNNERNGAQGGGFYTPDNSSVATYVDHLWVTTTGEQPRTADFGKVQVRVVGQSTGRDWNKSNIPNFNVDADEFVKGQRIDGYEHVRFGNGQVSNIFRERLKSELYRLLHYPAPRTTFAWVSSNVWGADVSIPYTLIERYKRSFCDRRSEELGGGCKNMWEFVGDFGGLDHGGPLPPQELPSIFDDPSNCQIEECDSSRVKELEALLVETPPGEGFKAATADYVDWPMFHRFQCLSYVFSTGDDALHNSNNVVLVERADGKFQYLPYSIDISLGQDWYPYEPLTGRNVLALGCQADKSCWADTMAECEAVIDELVALEPRKLLKEVYEELDEHGMLRPGDRTHYEFLDIWLTQKLEGLPEDLERYREPSSAGCGKGEVDCGGYCDLPENCPVQCIPPGKERLPVSGGVVGPIDECPAIELYQP